jgi:hypothetical protein
MFVLACVGTDLVSFRDMLGSVGSGAHKPMIIDFGKLSGEAADRWIPTVCQGAFYEWFTKTKVGDRLPTLQGVHRRGECATDQSDLLYISSIIYN